MKNLIKKLDENLVIIGSEYTEDLLTIDVKSKCKKAICPCCGKESNSIQSRYIRPIKDLPMQDYKVILNVHVRNFYCNNKKCEKRMFAEQFGFYEKYSRMTIRLKNKIIEMSKGMSARASKNVINESIAETSDDTILRLIKKTIKIDKDVKYVCIDDFAMKKRHKYGTVMINIENHQIIDILNSREVNEVAEWLKGFKNIKTESRDGAIIYNAAISQAFPEATQISDHIFA